MHLAILWWRQLGTLLLNLLAFIMPCVFSAFFRIEDVMYLLFHCCCCSVTTDSCLSTNSLQKLLWDFTSCRCCIFCNIRSFSGNHYKYGCISTDNQTLNITQTVQQCTSWHEILLFRGIHMRQRYFTVCTTFRRHCLKMLLTTSVMCYRCRTTVHLWGRWRPRWRMKWVTILVSRTTQTHVDVPMIGASWLRAAGLCDHHVCVCVCVCVLACVRVCLLVSWIAVNKIIIIIIIIA